MVDSDDLPLNVSRELLQKSRVLNIISKRLVRKALDMFTEIQEDEEKFAAFTRNFGRYLKVGVIEDKDNKDALLKLASFSSSASGERGATLKEYKERMPEGQKQIYYISGASKAAASASPVLERLKKQGYEVLFALDQIDEIALQGVGKYDDVDVVDASKENADLGELSDDEKKAGEEAPISTTDTHAAVTVEEEPEEQSDAPPPMDTWAKPSECMAWAGDGQCASNPKFMLEQCAWSCHKIELAQKREEEFKKEAEDQGHWHLGGSTGV